MPRKANHKSSKQAATTKGQTTKRPCKPQLDAAKQPANAKNEAAKRPRKPRESYCYASSWDEGERWTLHSVSNNRTYEDAMFTQGWPELFGQPNVGMVLPADDEGL